MILKLESTALHDYLACTPVIDFDHPGIRTEASRLSAQSRSPLELVKNTYEFVRDAVSHSADVQGTRVTCNASDVLEAKEGLCYAKSHLLVALLRCNAIPAGFCYQLLRLFPAPDTPLVLHGLVAVYVESVRRWIRLDARGNKNGIDAHFSTVHEQLAYRVNPEHGEIDFPIVFAAPDDNVIGALTTYRTLDELYDNLPQFPAKMDWCRSIDAESARQARLDVNPVGYCGHHCGHCFLGEWCGGCRSGYNRCSYATISEDGICPNVRCAGGRNLGGCYECEELAACKKGYYEREDEYVAKASAIFVGKYGEECYDRTLKLAFENGVNYPETFDSSGSVESALAILEGFNRQGLSLQGG